VIGDLKRVSYRPGLSITFARPEEKPRAAILFFHGGGWIDGDPLRFQGLWPGLLAEGIACATAEYGTKRRSRDYTIYDSIADAKAASMRFCKMFPALPKFVSGASSGGTLAILAAHDMRGCILFNPVLDLSANGFKNAMTPDGGDESISPLHMNAEFPRTLIFQGDADQTTPLTTAGEFAAKRGAELITLPKAGHGFVGNPLHTKRIIHTMLQFVGGAISNR
jgi:acetyl esterase/lipase